MNAKALILKLHLYSALATSVFLLALTLSGMLMMLEGNVLPSSFIAENHHLLPEGERSSVAAVIQDIEQRYGKTPTQLTVRDAERPDEYRLGPGQTVYVNPYSGQILANEGDFRTPFSRALWTFHASFFLGETGGWLAGTVTAILLLSLLSGAFLVGYAISKGGWQVLSLRWRSNGRIFNRRLHNLAGFVFLPVLCAIAFTGSLMAFKPVEDLTMHLIGAPVRMSNFPSSQVPAVADAAPVSVDEVLRLAAVFNSGAPFARAQLYFPSAPNDSFRVQIDATGGRRERELLFFDQYSGERLADPYGKEREDAENLYWSFRAFHYGSYFGPPMELAWFLGCLSLLLLVISGLLIWLAQKRRSTRMAPKPLFARGFPAGVD